MPQPEKDIYPISQADKNVVMKRYVDNYRQMG